MGCGEWRKWPSRIELPCLAVACVSASVSSARGKCSGDVRHGGAMGVGDGADVYPGC